MMKLLKYDWKRDSNTILSVLAVLVLAELSLHWFGSFKDWDPMIRLGLALVMYVSALVVMVITGSKGYIKSIRSYQRRLVPIRSIYHVLSSLVFSTLIILAVLAIGFAHFMLLFPLHEIKAFFELSNVQLTAWDIILGGASGIWGTFFIMLVVYFSMTVGAMVNIRGKAGVWVGIVVFVIISNAFSLISESLFNQAGSTSDLGIVQIETGSQRVSEGLTVTNLGTSLGSFLFELVVAALLLWLMSGPIRKRLEI